MDEQPTSENALRLLNAYLKALKDRMSKAGKARMKSMTAKQRQALARKAVNTRWAKAKAGKKASR